MFEPNCVIAVITPEATLKSPKVKARIISILRDNIRVAFKRNNLADNKVVERASRFFIYSENVKKTAFVLENVFGIHSLFLAEEKKFISLEELAKEAVQASNGIIKSTFAVRAKSFMAKTRSKEIEILLGSKILENIDGTKVNLSKPNNQLNVLLFEDKYYFWFEEIKGARGLPYSSQGKVCLMCSDKKNSLRLGYALLKSGCSICVVGEELDEINKKFYYSPEKISIEKAKQLFSDGKLLGFFSDAKTVKDANKFSKEMGVKAFAPLICVELKTPFD